MVGSHPHKSPTKVFISYSHDSDSHCTFVLGISELLRHQGVDCWLDQYQLGSPAQGWPLWMEQKIEWADFVLLVCSEKYYKRFKGEIGDTGIGVAFEGAVVTEALYFSGMKNLKFLPVLPADSRNEYVPKILRLGNIYTLPQDYEDLYRVLTNQPAARAGPMGKVVPLQALEAPTIESSTEIQATQSDHSSNMGAAPLPEFLETKSGDGIESDQEQAALLDYSQLDSKSGTDSILHDLLIEAGSLLRAVPNYNDLKAMQKRLKQEDKSLRENPEYHRLLQSYEEKLLSLKQSQSDLWMSSKHVQTQQQHQHWYSRTSFQAAMLLIGFVFLMMPADNITGAANAVLRAVSQWNRVPLPRMVNIPAGEFIMGSSDDEVGREPSEGPVHTVQVEAFQLASTEVTFKQYDVFARETGGIFPHDEGWGRGSKPVVNVTRENALAYIDWLNSNSEGGWRLPSEAEWEYAARAESTTPYFFGEKLDLLCGYVNGASLETGYKWRNDACKDDYEFTAPVGTFTANRWGLHDMHGNVWEWVQDCWHEDYAGSPVSAVAWVSDLSSHCRPVSRGGGWGNAPDFLRSAFRNGFDVDGGFDTGFRLARTPMQAMQTR